MDNEELLLKILSYVQLAPTPRNTQPWQLKLNKNEIFIIGHRSCLNPIADPDHRDTWISLGILIEILEKLLMIHCCEHEFFLLQHDLEIDHTQAIVRVNYKANTLKESNNLKYLELLNQRRAYRGPFKTTTTRAQFSIKNTYAITEGKELKKLTKVYNQCAKQLSLTPGYMTELRKWVRLSRNEMGYSKDGLDFRSLKYSHRQLNWARKFMNEKQFWRLKWLGLQGTLTNESKYFKNISGVVIKVMDNSALTPHGLINEGRAYISTWLELTSQGFEACPITNIINLPQGQNFLRRALNLSQGTEFSMAMRYGKGNGSPVRRIRRSLTSWAKEIELTSEPKDIEIEIEAATDENDAS